MLDATGSISKRYEQTTFGKYLAEKQNQRRRKR